MTNVKAEIAAAVRERLASIERDHGVRIPFAIESGSRAWGFPSPDSDYDCRFLFVRPAEHHLSPWQRRDVIELPLDGELDINGWDLGKALKLILKGNAVVIEWLMSPISYIDDGRLRLELLAFAERHASRSALARHYLHLGERQRRTYFADGKEVKAKKIFYALRPAVALRWMRSHPERTLPPMHFPVLLAESETPLTVMSLCLDLLERKARTRELGTTALPAVIRDFIDEEFALARPALDREPVRASDAARHEADLLFRAAIFRAPSPA